LEKVLGWFDFCTLNWQWGIKALPIRRISRILPFNSVCLQPNGG
jgi:hypothetical protein